MIPLGRVLVACFGILCALALPAAAQDDPGLRVLKSLVLPLAAGPANTAALLSPDGSHVLHIDIDRICTLGPADGQPWPQELVCAEKDAAVPRLRGAEDMAWSPDGTRLLLPTFARAFMELADTDIALLDSATLSRQVLTDDGFEGRILDHGPASLDVAARWVDDDTIAFLRYPIEAGGVPGTGTVALMTIAADGTGERRVLDIPGAQRLGVYALAISPDGRMAAYAIDDRIAPDAAGIWVAPLDGSAAPARVVTAEATGGTPVGLAYSADGTHLLSLVPLESTAFDARIVAVETGAVTVVDQTRAVTGAAWAPAGSALAYVTNLALDGSGGLFLLDAPGAPARLLLQGAFMAPVCCGRQPFAWAADDTMLLGRVDDGGRSVMLVRLGR